MPDALTRLIQNISLLPGIGENRATKLAFFLLKSHPRYLEEFSKNITDIKKNTGICTICGAVTDI